MNLTWPYLLIFLAAGGGNLTGDRCWYTLGFLGHFESSLYWFPPLKRLELQITRRN
jgi:hypothetical protein